MRKVILFIDLVYLYLFVNMAILAQTTQTLDSLFQQGGVCSLHKIQATDSLDNIKIQPLYSDSLVTTSMIWIKKGVKAHKHKQHTEQVYVIDGAATMTLGEDTLAIYAGDWIFIPQGVIHAVIEVHGERPIQVISVQTPLFVGKDRVFVEE